VERLADLDTPADEIRTGRFDVVDDQVQTLDRAGLDCCI
jgi:hypothetical protein